MLPMDGWVSISRSHRVLPLPGGGYPSTTWKIVKPQQKDRLACALMTAAIDP